MEKLKIEGYTGRMSVKANSVGVIEIKTNFSDTTLVLNKEEASDLKYLLGEVLKAANLESSNPPPDQL